MSRGQLVSILFSHGLDTRAMVRTRCLLLTNSLRVVTFININFLLCSKEHTILNLALNG